MEGFTMTFENHKNPYVEFWHASPNAGYRVIWFRDDNNNSGYGDNARVAVWYVDSLQEAIDLANCKNPPHGCKWQPVGSTHQ